MEKNNGYKVVAVASLLVGVLALTIGFAAYSATLNIETPEAVVSGDQFSPYVTFTGTPTCVVTGTDTVVTSAGTVSGQTWSGVSVTLAKPGDSVTCTATVQNASLLDAYLESVKAVTPITCEAYGSTNPATSYEDACNGMKLTAKVGNYDIATDSSATVGTTQDTMISGPIQNIMIQAKNGNVISSQDVSFTITYDANAGVADGDFKVNIPTMSLVYKTED